LVRVASQGDYFHIKRIFGIDRFSRAAMILGNGQATPSLPRRQKQ